MIYTIISLTVLVFMSVFYYTDMMKLKHYKKRCVVLESLVDELTISNDARKKLIEEHKILRENYKDLISSLKENVDLKDKKIQKLKEGMKIASDVIDVHARALVDHEIDLDEYIEKGAIDEDPVCSAAKEALNKMNAELAEKRD